jgi:mono/diheme cytochrome c family protein
MVVAVALDIVEGPKLLLPILFGLVGCDGLIEQQGQEGLSPEEAKAQAAWLQKAMPPFKANCLSCHNGSMASANPMPPAYLDGDSDLHIRDTILKFTPPVINLDSPPSSRVIVKGAHEGPALSAQDASGVVEWLMAEQAAQPAGTIIESTPMTAMPCTGAVGGPTCPVNHIDLSALGATGASIDFEAMTINGSDLYLIDLKVTAGTDGAYVVHPLFFSHPASAMDATADPIDRFYNVQLDVMSGANSLLGDGTATFTGFHIGDPLTVRFTTVDKYHP